MRTVRPNFRVVELGAVVEERLAHVGLAANPPVFDCLLHLDLEVAQLLLAHAPSPRRDAAFAEELRARRTAAVILVLLGFFEQRTVSHCIRRGEKQLLHRLARW